MFIEYTTSVDLIINPKENLMSLVGKNIDAYCLKCKLVLAHVVLFEVKDAVDRVKCKTCGAEHKYRPAAPKKKDSTAVPRKKVLSAKKTTTTKTPVNDAPIQWDLKSRNMQAGTPIKDYSIKGCFKVRDVINHPIFGVGFVEQVASDKSVYVLFSDSVKLMGMNVG
jgi:hypothetical protein